MTHFAGLQRQAGCAMGDWLRDTVGSAQQAVSRERVGSLLGGGRFRLAVVNFTVDDSVATVFGILYR